MWILYIYLITPTGIVTDNALQFKTQKTCERLLKVIKMEHKGSMSRCFKK